MQYVAFRCFTPFSKTMSSGQSKLWLDKPQKRPHISGTSALLTSYIQMQSRYIYIELHHDKILKTYSINDLQTQYI